MLQESMDKIKCRQRGCFPLISVAVFKPEAHLPVFELFDAVVGDSDSVDIRRQVTVIRRLWSLVSTASDIGTNFPPFQI